MSCGLPKRGSQLKLKHSLQKIYSVEGCPIYFSGKKLIISICDDNKKLCLVFSHLKLYLIHFGAYFAL
jgi:hypothetical protein